MVNKDGRTPPCLSSPRPKRVPPRLGLSIALRGLKAADERKCEHAQERLAQNHGSRLTPALIKHIGCRDLKATKIPCFQLTPVSNECLNFYRQFETAVSLTCIPTLGEWKCLKP